MREVQVTIKDKNSNKDAAIESNESQIRRNNINAIIMTPNTNTLKS